MNFDEKYGKFVVQVLDELGFVRGYRLDNNGNYIIDHSIEFQFPDEVPVRCASLGPFVIAAFNSGKLRVWHTVTWSQVFFVQLSSSFMISDFGIDSLSKLLAVII